MSNTNLRCGWAIIFQKEDLDKDGMREYFEENGVMVHDVIDKVLTIGNHATDIDKEVECVIFLLSNPGIMPSFKIKWELNLKETEQRYVYMPYEKGT